MFKRLVLSGALVISMVAMSRTEANAQSFGGWGWFGFSGVTAVIELFHIPNPSSKPSEIIITITANIQIACFNPANNGIFNGKAFRNTVGASIPLSPSDITTTKGNSGTGTVFLDLSSFEVNTNCTNTNWTPIQDSAETLNFTGTVQWCLIDQTTGLPDCSGKGLLDQSSVTCTLDTTQFPRNPNGTAPHGATLTCSAPQ